MVNCQSNGMVSMVTSVSKDYISVVMYSLHGNNSLSDINVSMYSGHFQ